MIKKDELAKLINVSRVTLYNWEKTKPELMKMIEGYYKFTQGEGEENELLKYYNRLDPKRQELYFTKIKLEVLEKEAEKETK
nr:MAG TPA: Transcriptional regulator, TetR family Alpha, Helix-Turn-Helix, Transcriptional Repressor.27A [Inoviridae sp.]DAW36612.1 MAG TPA: Transcriptional regulator, TetR family Alpha, Helix-Turn-Helix, Transcriptional Repressor.27A [Inoviridae sp.]